MKTPFFNRRKEERIQVAGCSARIFGKQFSCDAHVLDMSAGGAKMETETVPPRLEELRLAITNEKALKWYKAGVVVWYLAREAPETGYTVGIKFLKDIDRALFEET